MRKKLFELTKFLFSKQEFEKVKTKTGEISYDKQEVGAEVYEIINDEEVLVETEKEFELEDGTIIKTDELGLISEIKTPEMEKEDETEVEIKVENKEVEEVKDETKTETEVEMEENPMDVMKKEIEDMKSQISEILSKLEVIVPNKEEMEKSIEGKFSKIVEEIETIKNTPIFNKVEEKKVEKQTFSKQDDFKNYLMNLKNNIK